MLLFPELSKTVLAATSSVSDPVVADEGVRVTVYTLVETATAVPLLQPELVPPTVKSADVKPVTGSEKVTVMTMFSVLPNESEVAVIVSVGDTKSTTSVVN